jgi:hypothetical protein
MQPATGVPSFSLYRGSLLALLVGTALAVWLLVQQPTSGEGQQALVPRVLTPTAAAAVGQGTPGAATTPPAGPTSAPGAATTRTAVTGTGTPLVSSTPPVSGTAGATANTYVVVGGDTLSGICTARRPALANADCVEALRTLNSLPDDNISVGDTLRLPQ